MLSKVTQFSANKWQSYNSNQVYLTSFLLNHYMINIYQKKDIGRYKAEGIVMLPCYTKQIYLH